MPLAEHLRAVVREQRGKLLQPEMKQGPEHLAGAVCRLVWVPSW
jgi:hypothetical protein